MTYFHPSMEKPLVIDLFCGLGGWSEGFLAEGYRCVGFDVEAHRYPKRIMHGSSEKLPACGANVPGIGWTGFAKTSGVSWRNRSEAGTETDEWEEYPGELIIRDVRSIHGSELKDAAVIVASPPCQAYSYRAMPWKRAKALPPPDNTLFNECFRIQREASEAAGRYIPLIVENVRGAQKWVGRARWNYGSFYLWGDVPALMPMTFAAVKTAGRSMSKGAPAKWGTHNMGPGDQMHAEIAYGRKVPGMNWSDRSQPAQGFNVTAAQRYREGALYADRDSQGVKQHGSGHIWYRTGNGAMSSKSNSRKAASAMIAKIPYPLAVHIAQVFKPC